ncbi:leucine-rich repeat domain-containing protein [Clostridium saccharoperbutylacetonicum]|uniref:leucine-rich repeat domain-containing protein n=1 Tax=Clostridium saccharoperbutylacetonicum TaxID=36745 RepID=UPI000983A54C|nr:leucine-rich repeat domain-containing protein [Clostridium saccharoperbutylacetonicum]AQR95885.1 hypothetical protein CLSAP_32010 [Clostridium saccharoperbutylacetonicum]NSB31749.1 hypothetical protein [Clostridium saccharoperbutylacetonicum]
MKKLRLTKVIASTLVAASVLALIPIGANAEWRQDSEGWWYAESGKWAVGWRVINGNLYYFDSKGYMAQGKPNDFGEKDGLNDDGQFTNVSIHGVWAFCKQTGEIVAYLGSDSNVEIPTKIDNVIVTSIGYEAFYKYSNLKNITIPSDIIKIGEAAFYGCTNLRSVNIPASVKMIGDKSFSDCFALTNISVDNDNTNFKSINGVLYSKDETNILCYPAAKDDTNYTISNSTTIIGRYAFSKATKLTNIVIPNSVKTIGYRAFEGCTGLTEISIPDSVTSIVNSAFIGCTNLTRVTLPKGLTTIESSIFADSDSLISVTIPNSVTSIGMCSFGGRSTSFYVNSEAVKKLLIKSGVNESRIVLNS